jgi:hypothetical protein
LAPALRVVLSGVTILFFALDALGKLLQATRSC